jgi:hypothetical protein
MIQEGLRVTIPLKYKTLHVVAVEVPLVLQSTSVFCAHQFHTSRGEMLELVELSGWILSLAIHSGSLMALLLKLRLRAFRLRSCTAWSRLVAVLFRFILFELRPCRIQVIPRLHVRGENLILRTKPTRVVQTSGVDSDYGRCPLCIYAETRLRSA